MRVSEYKFVETDGKGWYAPIFDAAGHLVPAQEVLDRLNDNAALRADVQAARAFLVANMKLFKLSDDEFHDLLRRTERWA